MASSERPGSKATIVRVTVLVVTLVVGAGLGTLAVRSRGRAPSTRSCKPALPIGTVHGKTVAVQSISDEGEGYCGVPDRGNGIATLGTDCKVRSDSGKVIDSVPMSRDGTCDADE